jgi:hypothetical protein
LNNNFDGTQQTDIVIFGYTQFLCNNLLGKYLEKEIKSMTGPLNEVVIKETTLNQNKIG